MKIEIIPCLQDNYSYLIIDESNNTACVIDPSEAEPIINFIEKENIHLKYILNTHHHFDHIGGNQDLKNKYNSIVVGYKDDSNRIPEIEVLVEDDQIWKADNFEAKIIHVPGHTTGHISFYFFNDKLIFTGDTLFSLGCGRIFEGTYQEMFSSLNKIRSLPEDTNEPENLNLQNKISKINEKLKNNLPTIPTTLKDEIECNIFLRAKNVESFSKLRDLKDNF